MEHNPHEIALQVMRGYVNRGFSRTSKAWYARATLDKDAIEDMSIGFYFPYEGGTYGEFSMKWEKLGRHFCAKLSMWDDFWHLMPLFKDFYELLGRSSTDSDQDAISPDNFCAELLKLGFIDHTAVTDEDRPPEPDYAGQRLRAAQPYRVHEAFQHLFGTPFVVPFSGTTTFDKGVLVHNPHIMDYVEERCQGAYIAYNNDILFDLEDDALLVQMRFS